MTHMGKRKKKLFFPNNPPKAFIIPLSFSPVLKEVPQEENPFPFPSHFSVEPAKVATTFLDG